MIGHSVYLDHLAQEFVDVVTETSITLFGIRELLCVETTNGGVEFEGMEERVNSTEALTSSENLVNHIFQTDDTNGTKMLLNKGVAGDRNTLSVDASITTLVEKIRHSLAVGNTPGDIRSDLKEHSLSGFVDFDESSCVGGTKTKKLENLANLGSHTIRTENTNDNEDRGLLGSEELLLSLGRTTKTNIILGRGTVLSNKLLSTLKNNLLASCLGLLCGLLLQLALLLGFDLGGQLRLDILTLLQVGFTVERRGNAKR